MNLKAKLITAAMATIAVTAPAETTIPVMDHVSFYDGYLVSSIPEDAPDQGCLRLYTYLNSVRLTDQQLDQIGDHLNLNVTIHAVCDNYDRIGSVNLAFIPKGDESYKVEYNDNDPMRIEIARFITPFMNKNKTPKEVPYRYKVDNLSQVLRDRALREAFDIWVELEVFGVPYAAQQQVSGCSGCNHVFDGSLEFVTDDEPAAMCDNDVFVPVITRRSDWRADRGMNNYNEACTDEIGRTIRTFHFDVPQNVASGRMVIIMSNHGAGTNGEEYVRRQHYATFDGEAALEWRPGRTTCEPYRQYNTQSNGIYGRRPMSDASWQSFSNWCPGAPIPYRTFETGALSAGDHWITIEVPDAKFSGNDGYFPVSIYFQGNTQALQVAEPYDEDSGPAGVEAITADDYTSSIHVEGNTLSVTSADPIEYVEVYDAEGRIIMGVDNPGALTSASVDISACATGVYIVAVTTSRRTEAHKFSTRL